MRTIAALFNQVKDDNHEIATMERHIKELNDQIEKANETIQNLDEVRMKLVPALRCDWT